MILECACGAKFLENPFVQEFLDERIRILETTFIRNRKQIVKRVRDDVYNFYLFDEDDDDDDDDDNEKKYGEYYAKALVKFKIITQEEGDAIAENYSRQMYKIIADTNKDVPNTHTTSDGKKKTFNRFVKLSTCELEVKLKDLLEQCRADIEENKKMQTNGLRRFYW